jgi:hypothetical protein
MRMPRPRTQEGNNQADVRHVAMNFIDLLTPALTSDPTDTVYYVSDVTAVLSAPQKARFEKWLRGKPLLVVNDRGALYKYELEQFFEKL